MSEPIGETTTKTMEESEERNSERHHSKSSSHKKKKKKSSDREHSSSSRRRRSSSSNNGERRSSGDRDSSKKKKRRKSESGERKHRSSRHRESSSSRRRSGREDDPGAAVAKPPPSEQPAVTASPGNQPSAKPGAVSASGGSQQTGKQRRSYGAAAQKPGAVSMSGDGSPQKSGKERPRSTAMPRGDTAQSGKTRQSAPAQRPGAVSMSGDGTTQQQSGKERRAAAQRPGAVSMSGGSQTGKQSRRRSGTTNSEHQQQQQQPGAVAVASPVKRGKGQKSADAGPSMASSADAYALSSRRVGAVADPTPGIRTKDPDVSRTRSGLSSTGDSSRVGATAVASAAPRGKRSRQSRRAPSSDAGSSENTSGHSSNDNDNDRFSSGNPSLGTHVGAYSVAAGASSRGKGDKGKGDGPSVASGAESYDDASRLGAHSVSSAPRRKRGDGSVVSRDGSSTGGVGAQAVASSGSVRKNGAGPTLSEGGDDYSRQNSLSNHSESGKEKGRVSHFPTSDLYASLSSLPGLGTNTENKGRISQFPGEDFYEQDIDDEPLSSHRRSSAGGLPDESEKSRPEYTANGESYGGSRNDQSRRSTRSHHSDQQSRGSSEHPSRRGPTGAFFISGDGENFESRDAVGPLNDGENTSNIDLLASQDTNTSNIDLLDAEAQLTAEVTPVANPPAEGAPNYAMDTSLDNTKPKPWYCSRIFLILVALLVVIGGTVGAVLPLVVFKDGDGGGGLAPPTSSPTSPIDLEREDTIRAIVLELTDVATLDDPSSPQNAAYEWIVKTDMLSPVTIGAVTTEETEKVASRYSLAVFYYATNGDDWISATGWLDGNVDECNWEILSCSNQRVSAISSGAAVAGNNMKGGIPSEIRALTTLTDLVLPSNELKILHPNMGMLPILETLNLSDNTIEGKFPEFIYQITSLKNLDLGINALTGPLSESLSRLTNLEALLLQKNRLSGFLIDQLAGLKSLRYLDLSSNSFGGQFHTVLNGLENLVFVYLDSNSFDGRLDGQRLLLFPELEELVVSLNSLAGPIPGEFGSLTKLSTLILDSNKLSGTIPSNLANMAPLATLNIQGNNKLDGGVPTELCDVPTLTQIQVTCGMPCTCPSCQEQCAE